MSRKICAPFEYLLPVLSLGTGRVMDVLIGRLGHALGIIGKKGDSWILWVLLLDKHARVFQISEVAR